MPRPSIAARLVRQPPRQWLWIIEAFLCLAAARLMIRVMPFRLLRRWLGPIGSMPVLPLQGDRGRHAVRQTRRWIRQVAAHAPFRAVCLPQAMAARWMLARRGIASELHIGARRGAVGAQRPIDLHAWLLCGDLCVTGAGARPRFSGLAAPAQGQRG
jgi:hypothetical protein